MLLEQMGQEAKRDPDPRAILDTDWKTCNRLENYVTGALEILLSNLPLP